MELEKKNWKWVFLVGWAAWTLLGLFSSLIRIVQENEPVGPAMTTVMLAHYLMGLLSIPVWFWITRVLPPRSLPFKIFGHFAGAWAYALLWHTLYHAFYPVFLGWQAYRNEPFQYYYLHHINDAVKAYLMITIAYLAWIYHQKRQEAHRLAAEKIAQHRQIQLAVLKTQLNPHFLFNCLNSINALVADDPEKARSMLADLGDTLRYSLDSDRIAEVPFLQEQQFTATYLRMEKARFGERLHIVWNIDPAALSLPVPPMILQPLVENAVRHGVAPSMNTGTITIAAKRRDGAVHFSVADDGVGNLQSPEKMLSQGHGLHHTHQRLLTLFPEHRGLHLESDAKGFRVAFTIPDTKTEAAECPQLSLRRPVHV